MKKIVVNLFQGDMVPFKHRQLILLYEVDDK